MCERQNRATKPKGKEIKTQVEVSFCAFLVKRAWKGKALAKPDLIPYKGAHALSINPLS